VKLVVQGKSAPDDLRIAPKPRFPKARGQHRDRSAAFVVFAGGESTPEDRLDPEHWEDCGRSHLAAEPFRVRASCEIERRGAIGSHGFKGAAALLPIQEVGIRNGRVT